MLKKWVEEFAKDSVHNPRCASPYNLAISPKHFANSRMMIAIKRRRADFLLLFVFIWPIVKWQNGGKRPLRAARHITLPLRHIKATMRTGKTGKASTCSHKKTCEIFWQAVSDNLHIRPFYVAKSQTKADSPIRKFARISRVWWQGITAKPAKNYDKAQ